MQSITNTRNIRVLLQYDGTDFHGFQKQQGGVRTVQGELEDALFNLLGEQEEIIGASRTDAGVHALGQVVNFKASHGVIPPDKVAAAAHRFLPSDISLVSSEGVPLDFHARYSAKSKEYLYVCYRSPHPIPFLRRNALEVHPDINIERMREASACFIGTHDFSAFRNESDTPVDPVKTIYSFDVEERDKFVLFRVKGSGFLYRMVRNMAGTLLEVGRGRWKSEYVREILLSCDRVAAGPTLPPHALYLLRVEY